MTDASATRFLLAVVLSSIACVGPDLEYIEADRAHETVDERAAPASEPVNKMAGRFFVRTRTSTGRPIEWRGQGCPILSLDAAENPGIPHARLREVLTTSAEAWNGPPSDRLKPELSIRSDTVTGKDVGYDGTNLVVWRLKGYCQDPAHREAEICLSQQVAAITTVFYWDKPGESRDGEIIEVDLELNADSFEFSLDGEPSKLDLENTVAHEMGHMIGLDHTCIPGAGGTPVDFAGQALRSCYPTEQLTDAELEATMYAFEARGETKKRDPEEDEWLGVRFVHEGHSGQCAQSGVQPQPGCAAIPAGARRDQ